jgi:hypothetical protein
MILAAAAVAYVVYLKLSNPQRLTASAGAFDEG